MSSFDVHPYVRLALNTVSVWSARARQRRQLLDITESSPQLLRDIGVSREQALAESFRPFWEPLPRRRSQAKVCICGGLGHRVPMTA